MVAHVKRREDAGLIVAFHRQAERVESIFCGDGTIAWSQAMHLLTKNQPLEAGDSLLVLDAAADPDELPEASRASHMS